MQPQNANAPPMPYMFSSFSDAAVHDSNSNRSKSVGSQTAVGSETDRCYSENEIHSDQTLTDSSLQEEDYYPENTETDRMLRHRRSRSVVVPATMLNKSKSCDTFPQKRNNIEKLRMLSRDDLQTVYVREREHRLRQKEKYKRMSQQFKERITKNADEYEDELQENEDAMKQQYETKLIEAEIQRNASHMKITQLSHEIQRLKILLMELVPSSTNNVAMSMRPVSFHDSATVVRPPPIMIPQPQNRSGGSTPAYGNNTPIAAQMMTNITPMAAQINKTYSFPMERKEMKDAMDEGMPSLNMGDSMGRKLKLAMVPSSGFMKDGETDDDDYEKKNVKESDVRNSNDETDENEKSVKPKKKKKKKKRKKKKKKRQPSFWDGLIECIAPSICACEDITPFMTVK